jgi:hypothetical protein
MTMKRNVAAALFGLMLLVVNVVPAFAGYAIGG